MRTVLIQRGECSMFVQWFDGLCPICRTVVRAGNKHHCRLRTKLDAVGTTGGKATVETLQPHKGAK
jgi:predicted DCC family thiol-disulfide oxidoreductase YuxK